MAVILRDVLKIVELAAALVLPVSLALAPTYPLLTLLAAGATVILAVATFVLYAEAMRLKALRDKNQLSLWHYPWAFVVLGVGLPFDAALNIVAGAYWREWPRWRDGEVLLTARLQRWVDDEYHPDRQEWAQRVCRVLNRYDEGHC